MPHPDPRSLSGHQTPIEPDFDPKAALQQAAAQRAAALAADVSLDGKETDIGGMAGESNSTADLKAAADHLDDVEFERVDFARQFEIQEKLGQGGMGVVYRAIERSMQRPVAIKRLKPELVANRRALARFRSEAIAVAALNHENIVTIYRLCQDDISPFLVLELVEGGSLADRLRERKLDLDEAVRMFIALANGLSICHIQNIIHRDIKPGNILLTPKGVPKLSDFGIAKQQGAISISQVNGVIGTYSYMSPEQERGEKATERSDLFSLAKTLYHAVTGEFSNTVREKRIPELIREITLKALEDDPSLRHSTVAEFATELRSVQMQLSGPASVAHDSVDLKDGECAHCHTINAVTRKFCKARDCGKPLVEPCPVCLADGKSSPTPVWEARCGECNTVIEDYWADTEQDLENQAQEIETLAAEQNYEAALESLKPFHSLSHARTKAWKDWASEIAATYQAQLTEQQTHRVRLHSEAQSAFESAKYALVTTLLDLIHTSQITPEIRSLRASATALTQELDQLLETLKQQAKTKDYEGLRRNVDRVLTISPGDKRVSTLDQQLRDRDESIRKRREQTAIEKRRNEALLLKEHQEREQATQEALRVQRENMEMDRRDIDKMPSLTDAGTNTLAGFDSEPEFKTSQSTPCSTHQLDDIEFESFDLEQRYEMQGEISTGGMGVVYRANDEFNGWPVAIKRLTPELTAIPQALASFRREADALALLSHENIVRFIRCGRDKKSPFIVMELISGGSLAHRISKGPLELEEAVKMFVQLASGIAYSHQRSIIHRDIKPGNILLTRDGIPKLIDFGIAYREDTTITKYATGGTQLYMAPEQFNGTTIGNRLSDLYSLAASFYHAVSGQPPHSIREHLVPEPVRALTMKALRLEPDQRYFSVDEFADELRLVQLHLSAVKASQQPNAASQASTPPPSSLQTLGTKLGDASELLLPGGIKHKLLWCPRGTFLMGSPASEPNRSDDEQQVSVTLTKGFWLGQTVVTQAIWTAVMKTKPWSGQKYVKEGADFPAVHIDHTEATSFCGELTKIERAAGRLPADWKYALPTEAQWEYACRAGTETAYSFGDSDRSLGEYAWFDKNADDVGEKYAHAVGTKKPNPWGFYDMHGNVWEWCRDVYAGKLPGGSDPLNTSAVDRRVLRGGSWIDSSRSSRSAHRNRYAPGGRSGIIGFRVVRTE